MAFWPDAWPAYRFPVGIGGQPGPIATFLELGAVQIYQGS
jgi:hypothetical protein